jgi:hypothetical protein
MACSWIQSLRKPKILDMSIFDWVTSLLAAFLVGYFLMKLRGYINWALFIVGWTLAGVAIHKLFGVNTMLGYYMGLNPKPIRKEC